MNKRRLLFRLGAVAILIAIAACMMVIGRGHTVYIDNKTLEYNGETYKTPYRVNVYVGEERIAKLSARERGMTTNIGQNFKMTLGEIKREIPLFNEEMSVADIWDSLLKHKEQIGGIIDEYGSFQGIITLEDIIETIFGLEIIDESDEVSDMQQYARERWEQRQRRFKEIKLPEENV